VMVAGIELVHRQTALSEDTAIGLLFVGMLALGVVLISRSESYSGSLTAILFGDALGVTRTDLVGQAVLAVLVIALTVLLYRPLLALSFDRQKAELLGMNPRRTHGLLLVLIAAAVIGSYQSVGTLLVFGLLVGPPATAALLARSVPMMMAMAAVISVVSVWLGLVLSFHLGTAGSATMAIVPIVVFFLTLAATRARDWRRRRTLASFDESAHAGVTVGRP
jgi:ABC-type Mn2+/Zn2+ transport system permease subunit